MTPHASTMRSWARRTGITHSCRPGRLTASRRAFLCRWRTYSASRCRRLPPTLDALRFTRDDLSEVRCFVARHASAAGFEPERAADLLIAINELATNSVIHGEGTAHSSSGGRAPRCCVR